MHHRVFYWHPWSLLENHRNTCLRIETWRVEGASPGDEVVMRTILWSRKIKRTIFGATATDF